MSDIQMNVGSGCRIKVRASKPLVVRNGNVILITKRVTPLKDAGIAA